MQRKAQVERNTLETQIRVVIDLDGTGVSRFDTGIPFLEHMLDQVARHGLIDLDIQCQGDRHIDDHHSVEDIGITLGQAMTKALGDKKGIVRLTLSWVVLACVSRITALAGTPNRVASRAMTWASEGG